uniref:Solute carrier family 13 member 1 n=1 Tax=Lates calcarifer TaxID=8187 RepID=A0A4W6DUK6_LATCA
MATYWVTEVIPLSMTAMLPAILFPMFGIMKSSSVAKEYFKDFHFLLVGVTCFATSIEKWGLHRRIALRLVTMVGVNPAWLMLGFMTVCAFLSMWVQNTSAVTMVMPIVEAVLQHILKAKEDGSEDTVQVQPVSQPAAAQVLQPLETVVLMLVLTVLLLWFNANIMVLLPLLLV